MIKKPYAEITMYSGICHLDPRTEISEEQSIEIEEMISKLSEPFTDIPYSGTGVLSEESYMIVFPEDVLLYINNNGHIKIHTIIHEIEYKDTVGLHQYLKELLAPALTKHREDFQKQWEEYSEKVFRIPE